MKKIKVFPVMQRVIHKQIAAIADLQEELDMLLSTIVQAAVPKGSHEQQRYRYDPQTGELYIEDETEGQPTEGEEQEGTA